MSGMVVLVGSSFTRLALKHSKATLGVYTLCHLSHSLITAGHWSKNSPKFLLDSSSHYPEQVPRKGQHSGQHAGVTNDGAGQHQTTGVEGG